MFLHAKIQGEGFPILLIHGLFGDSGNLNLLAKDLQSDFQTIQIDLPNHGESTHLSEISYPLIADAVWHYLEKQGIQQLHLIGHSMGGKVAMAMALLKPKAVQQLVVLDIAPVAYESGRHDNVFAGLMASLKKTIVSRADAEHILAQHIETPSVRQFLLKSLKKTNQTFEWCFDVPGLKSNYPAIMDWTVRGSFLGKTLFLKGEHSDYMMPSHQTKIIALFPNSKAHLVANTGHWLHAEKPETVARVIRRFLQNSER